MNEKELKRLKDEFGYSPASYEYVAPAFEIEKYIGQNVILVNYKKSKEQEGKWETSTEMATIISIYDYDPMTMTSKIKYKVLKESEEEQVEEETRIQPEGYEFVSPDVDSFKRFQPISLHYKMIEDEFFFFRLKNLYDSRETLGIEQLKTISESKNQGQILRYSNNIGAAITLEDGSLIWIRIHTLRLKHRQGNTYGLFFSTSDKKEWSTVITSDEKEYTIGDWGKFKIIDLSD